MPWESVSIGDTTKAVAADVVSGAYFQGVKLVDPTDSSSAPLVVMQTTQPALPVVQVDAAGSPLGLYGLRKVTSTPTLGTGACVQYDALHTTVGQFTGVVPVSGGAGHIYGAKMTSKHATFAGIVAMYIASASITGTTAQDVLAISDADNDLLIGPPLMFDFSKSNFTNGRVAGAARDLLPMPFVTGATTLYYILQLWSADTPTFAASDLVPALYIQPD